MKPWELFTAGAATGWMLCHWAHCGLDWLRRKKEDIAIELGWTVAELRKFDEQ